MRFEQSTSVHYQAISHMKWNDNGLIMNLLTGVANYFFKKAGLVVKSCFPYQLLGTYFHRMQIAQN